MYKVTLSKLMLIKVVLWVTIYFSTLAFVYHIRWFIPFLLNNDNHAVVPDHEIPLVWFMVQICSNLIFLYVSWLLIRLFKKYQQTGYFDTASLKVFNGVIFSCLGLALLGAVKIILNNFGEIHISEWRSTVSIVNLFFRSLTRLVIFNSPQTFYLLLAIILWAVKQFVITALAVKQENESFI